MQCCNLLYFNPSGLTQHYVISLLRASTLQEELKKKAASLSDTQQQLERCEQDKAALKLNLDKLTQEGKTQHAELDRKAQSLSADLQKAQQEKEAQRQELATTQESLGKANKALKESQSQLDTERKNHKSAMEERVGSLCYIHYKHSVFMYLFQVEESGWFLLLPQEVKTIN